MSKAASLKFRLPLTVLLVPYSLMWEVFYVVALGLSWVRPKFRQRMGIRGLRGLKGDSSASPQLSMQGGSVFFCSSAGEYEQAKPIVREIQRRDPNHGCAYVCFSSSGYRFAEVRGEEGLFFLSPPDNPVRWMRVFFRLKPSQFFVVRHELWPGFLWAASFFGPVYLVDGALPSSGLSRLLPGLKAPLLRMISKVFVVDRESQQYFVDSLDQDPARVKAVGDTKYDQVWFRMQQVATASHTSEARISKAPPGCVTIIIGSAWDADAECVVDALAAIGTAINWRLIVVPHDLSPERLQSIGAICEKLGKPVRGWSSFFGETFDVLLVDRMGLLTDMYACADVAFVGGAMHHRVHNVLEPACYGLALAHGQRFQSSTEARRLVEAGLTTVIADSSDFCRFLLNFKDGQIPKGKTVTDFVRSLCGSSEKIVSEVFQK